MASFAAIRAGIAANLAPLTDPGLSIGDDFVVVHVSQYAMEDPLGPTVSVRGLDFVDYTEGGPDLAVTVEAIVGTVTEIGPQVVLDQMLFGSTAIKDLLESDKTLGGSVDDSFVTTMSGHKVFVLPNKRVLGAEWTLKIVLSD